MLIGNGPLSNALAGLMLSRQMTRTHSTGKHQDSQDGLVKLSLILAEMVAAITLVCKQQQQQAHMCGVSPPSDEVEYGVMGDLW